MKVNQSKSRSKDNEVNCQNKIALKKTLYFMQCDLKQNASDIATNINVPAIQPPFF